MATHEKDVDEHLDEIRTSSEKAGHSEESTFSDVETKRLLRKVDYRLLPVLTLLYLMSFLDRSNIGNARVAGLDDSLALSDFQYNMCLTIFFFPYAFFEARKLLVHGGIWDQRCFRLAPSNVVLKFLKPRLWLTIIVLAWGTVMTLMGLVQSYAGLLAARFFLGITECRHEMQMRLALFYSAASIAGAFCGLLAFALDKMEGISGLDGWRWIFIIGGLMTVLLGFVLPFVMWDSPEKANFFSDGERAYFVRRLQLDYNTGGS